MSSRYVLDANPFIEAKNRHYGFDIVPGFWRCLLAQHKAKRICSIDRICKELLAQDDEIKDWIGRQVPDSFFKKTQDKVVVNAFREMANWVYSNPQYTDAAKAEFADAADGWVIAYARANAYVVVTHERFAPDIKTRVPMPNVCEEFGVAYVDTFEMLRALEERFVRSKISKGQGA